METQVQEQQEQQAQAQAQQQQAPLTFMIAINQMSGQYARHTNAANAAQLQTVAAALQQEAQRLYRQAFNIAVGERVNGSGSADA